MKIKLLGSSGLIFEMFIGLPDGELAGYLIDWLTWWLVV